MISYKYIEVYSALHEFAASPIAFISHERKQVVIQFLNDIIQSHCIQS